MRKKFIALINIKNAINCLHLNVFFLQFLCRWAWKKFHIHGGLSVFQHNQKSYNSPQATPYGLHKGIYYGEYVYFQTK